MLRVLGLNVRHLLSHVGVVDIGEAESEQTLKYKRVTVNLYTRTTFNCKLVGSGSKCHGVCRVIYTGIQPAGWQQQLSEFTLFTRDARSTDEQFIGLYRKEELRLRHVGWFPVAFPAVLHSCMELLAAMLESDETEKSFFHPTGRPQAVT